MITGQPRALRAAVLLLAVALLALTALVGWRMVAQQNDIHTLVTALAEHDHDAARDRAAAAADRRTAAANQKALLDYTAALAARQDALLSYLREHGIHLPQRLVTVIPPPRLVVRHHRRAGHHVKRHRSTASGSSTAPAGPGKSGRAPGHHKHPRHGHRHR